ncbi:collagen alpha-1(I) chain-like [Pan paniscus]|uniref:collagen alpha-1(I) chain-like n=1 Tax=Pan paniscus TaxID=9597 RepID=UPI0030065B93
MAARAGPGLERVLPARPSSCSWARARRRLAGQGPSVPGGYQLRGCPRARAAGRALSRGAQGSWSAEPGARGAAGAAAGGGSALAAAGAGLIGRVGPSRPGRDGPGRWRRPQATRSSARSSPGAGRAGGRGRGGSSGLGSALTPRPGDRGWGEGGVRRAEGVGAGSGRRGPGQVQRPPRAQLPPGRASRRPAPRAGRYRAPRSRPPRQRPQIGGAAAPRVTAGPGPAALPLSFPLPSAAPRDASAAPGPLRRGLLLPAVCRGKRRRPGGRARFWPGQQLRPSGGLRPGRFLGPPPARGRRRRQLQPLGSSPEERGAGAQAKSLPGAAGRLRRRMSSPPGGDPVPHARLGKEEAEAAPRERPKERLGLDPGDARAAELPAPVPPPPPTRGTRPP